MSNSSRIRFALPLAALLAGACVPQLQQKPGSDMVSRAPRARVKVTRSSASCTGQKGVSVSVPVGVTPAGVVAASGSGGACATARGDTIPDPSADRTQPARPTP